MRRTGVFWRGGRVCANEVHVGRGEFWRYRSRSQPYPSILPLRDHYTALYMELLYIIFHSLVRNIGCGIDQAILNLL